MKNQINKTLLATLACGAAGTSPILASTDYGPAIWRPACASEQYTTGYGKKCLVVHDMEGYYAYGVTSGMVACGGSTVSVHYAINGLKDATSDFSAGEVTQMVRHANYGWHARCWNKYSIGCEHEGFASNPAWYTDAMYASSSSLYRHLADTYGIAKDRNHIIAHGQKVAQQGGTTWVNWAWANMPSGFDPNCNTHTDPGIYWDWTRFMNMVNGGGANNASVVSSSYPSTVTVGQTFSATVTMNNNGTKNWLDVTYHALGSQNPADNTRWGLSRVGVAGTITPGQNKAFTFNCTAPTTAGSYAFDWKMLEESVEWFGATSGGGITVNAAGPVQVVVDNNSAGFAASASWVVASSAPDKYGADYRYRSTAAVSDQATWTGSLPSAGSYGVYAWWTAGANRAANIGYTVYHATGSTTANVNQQATGGQWRLLTTASLNAGNNQVKLSCWTTTGFVVVADAILWQK